MPETPDPTPASRPQARELARRLRAYMGYADQTLEQVAARLQALGVAASASTVNRWARGQSVPNVFAAQALGRLVEDANLAPAGDGTKWLLGAGQVAGIGDGGLDRTVGNWHFRTSSPALSDALAERGVPAAYRKPLADLLARLLQEIDPPPDDPDDPDARS